MAVSDRIYLRPVIASSGIHALAGGPLRFTDVQCLIRTAEGARTIGGEPEPAALARLTRPRPRLPGLTGEPPYIAGILNVTPDSFSDGGLAETADDAIAHGLALMEQGADMIDVGGESTRPGAPPVPEEEEVARIEPVIRALAQAGAVISVDTRKAAVMRAALSAGAQVVNDVSALTFDPKALGVVAEAGVPVILMHSRGTPETMGRLKRYDNLAMTVFDELSERIQACLGAGIEGDRILIDPGVGFAKGPEQNLVLLNNLALLHGLGYPVMIGTSRKSFIGKIGDAADPRARLPGSLASGLWAVSQGAQYLRVHDVAETRQALAIWNAIASDEGEAAPTT